VASLAQLVESPALNRLLGYVVRPRAEPAVETVALVEDLGDIERVPPKSIVLLTRKASADASTYRFDVALRLARRRRIGAFVLTAKDVGRITATAAAIANRSGTAILGTADDADLAALAVALGRELAGGADVALLRAGTAIRVIEAHPPDGRIPALLEHAGEALGVSLSLVTDEPHAGPRRAVVVDGHLHGWVAAPGQQGDLALAVDIVLHATAGAIAAVLSHAGRVEELPIQSREETLTELLAAPAEARSPAVQRARSLGLPIDGWHVASRLEFEDLANLDAGQEVAAHQDRHRLARAALEAVRADGGTWHSARAGGALLLVRMYAQDPGLAAAAEVAKVMDRALVRLRSRLPVTLIRCGVGSAHPGPAGLVASVGEAKAATTAARASGHGNTVVPFDSVGLRRTLVEWYATDTAREAVMTVLAPLVTLGGARAERLIRTLHVYLDQQGSLTRTAEALSLHRNAVAYRVNQIFGLLDVDQDSPDDLLLLQLACRARELGVTTAP
jgi:sugar diacid utilization regulator